MSQEWQNPKSIPGVCGLKATIIALQICILFHLYVQEDLVFIRYLLTLERTLCILHTLSHLHLGRSYLFTES